MKLYRSAQLRALDGLAVQEAGIPGLALMKRAAAASAQVIRAEYPEARRCLVCCGSGNNAGDGFLVAGMLADKGLDAQMLLLGRAPQAGTDAGAAHAWAKERAPCLAAEGVDLGALAAAADLVVDALLGLGIQGEVRPQYRQAIAAINGAGTPVVALDLPSGLCADTGRALGACVKAAHTVTFVGRKLGLCTNDGPEYAGQVHFASLGIPDALYDRFALDAVDLLDLSLRSRLPARHRNAHKRAHGHLLVIGGNEGMGGAALLAGEAAMQTGAGLVTLATRSAHVGAILARRPELMPKGVAGAGDLAPLLARATCLLLGPGLGQDAWSRKLFAAAMQSRLPMVVDADGLNLLAAGDGDVAKRDNWALTPHPGEAARLLGRQGIQEDRAQAALDLQARYGGTALLKGQGSLVASPHGLALCPYGNPGLAVAGTGDVLAGLIASLLAQGLAPAEAARLGAVLHGRAADLRVAATGERGLLASDLPPAIRALLNAKAD